MRIIRRSSGAGCANTDYGQCKEEANGSEYLVQVRAPHIVFSIRCIDLQGSATHKIRFPATVRGGQKYHAAMTTAPMPLQRLHKWAFFACTLGPERSRDFSQTDKATARYVFLRLPVLERR
jgi:hypothetical protein